MASGASSVQSLKAPAGKTVFLAWAVHVYTWFAVSLLCIAINAIHLFVPPWALFVALPWGAAALLHGGVTYLIVDAMKGDFKGYTDKYILGFIPGGIRQKAEALVGDKTN